MADGNLVNAETQTVGKRLRPREPFLWPPLRPQTTDACLEEEALRFFSLLNEAKNDKDGNI